MPVREYNLRPGDGKLTLQRNTSLTAATGGATSLCGTFQLRVAVDDSVATSRQEVLRALQVVIERVTEEPQWPPGP